MRFAECDRQARVFNSHYLTYADVALTEFLREATGSYARLGQAGYELVLAETTLRFLAPARFDDTLLLHTIPAPPGSSSLQLTLRIERADTLLATVQARYVCVDAEHYAKVPWPAWFRDAVAAYVPSI